jgi:hypothetical protein
MFCETPDEPAGVALTGRIGYAMSPADELQNVAPIGLLPIRSATLIYGKAGVARANSQIDMAINNDLAGFAGPDITSNNTNTTFWGWTVGLGIEQALSAAWSLKVEYDYIGFPSPPARACPALRRFRDSPIPTCKQIPANCSAASTVRGGFSSKASSAPARIPAAR